MKYNAIDLFSGCGGLSEGMRQAGFDVSAAVEINSDATAVYELNHPKTKVIRGDIRKVNTNDIKKTLNNKTLHLLAGCPPCQGFSSMRRLNRKEAVADDRNDLILEFMRFVKELKPITIMMENVPGLRNYSLFKEMCKKLRKFYNINVDVVDIKKYGIAQSRKRLVLVGSLKGVLEIAEGTGESVTVRDIIGNMEPIEQTEDYIHKMIAHHTEKVKDLIMRIPKNGGSRKDLPDSYTLACHKKKNIGFNDVYGRLRWDDFSSTITSGCLNPSKGRFLHPEEDRVISAREAALLQSFPRTYKFPPNITKTSLASLIGNALPPKFSFIQCKNIKKHLEKYIG
jgi:DNA (cytosine-5)-methyltransferase 1